MARTHARIVVTQPLFHNPTRVCTTPGAPARDSEDRPPVRRVCRRGPLRPTHTPQRFAADAAAHDADDRDNVVVHIRSLSKVTSPGAT